jgi:hypothetical protein
MIKIREYRLVCLPYILPFTLYVVIGMLTTVFFDLG